MQLRFRITLVFTLIVTFILLVLCVSIYVFSESTRDKEFQSRLAKRALSTVELLKSKSIGPDLIKDISRASPSAFSDKSIVVFDYRYGETFSYNDDDRDSLVVSDDILQKARTSDAYFFQSGNRKAVAVQYKKDSYDYIVLVAAYDQEKKDMLSRLLYILGGCFLFSICVAFITGYIFSLGLVKSISRLTYRINHISSAGLSLRLETGSGKDEFQQLAVTINNLLGRLQVSFDTQRRFIDNASHELSTPLASISSQLDIALQRERSGEEYQIVLSSVNDDVKDLNMLLRSLLEIAKVSGTDRNIELVQVRVDELLLRLPAEMKKINASYIVHLDFGELPEDENKITVFGNEHLLFSALKNIVHNACKYANDKTAFVNLKLEDGNILIDIKDNGPGIASEEMNHIFQPFYRSGEANKSSIPGSGLGLSLANHIVHLYSGTITVHSVPGIGSTFTVTLHNEVKD